MSELGTEYALAWSVVSSRLSGEVGVRVVSKWSKRLNVSIGMAVMSAGESWESSF